MVNTDPVNEKRPWSKLLQRFNLIRDNNDSGESSVRVPSSSLILDKDFAYTNSFYAHLLKEVNLPDNQMSLAHVVQKFESHEKNQFGQPWLRLTKDNTNEPFDREALRKLLVVPRDVYKLNVSDEHFLNLFVGKETGIINSGTPLENLEVRTQYYELLSLSQRFLPPAWYDLFYAYPTEEHKAFLLSTLRRIANHLLTKDKFREEFVSENQLKEFRSKDLRTHNWYLAQSSPQTENSEDGEEPFDDMADWIEEMEDDQEGFPHRAHGASGPSLQDSILLFRLLKKTPSENVENVSAEYMIPPFLKDYAKFLKDEWWFNVSPLPPAFSDVVRPDALNPNPNPNPNQELTGPERYTSKRYENARAKIETIVGANYTFAFQDKGLVQSYGYDVSAKSHFKVWFQNETTIKDTYSVGEFNRLLEVLDEETKRQIVYYLAYTYQRRKRDRGEKDSPLAQCHLPLEHEMVELKSLRFFDVGETKTETETNDRRCYVVASSAKQPYGQTRLLYFWKTKTHQLPKNFAQTLSEDAREKRSEPDALHQGARIELSFSPLAVEDVEKEEELYPAIPLLGTSRSASEQHFNKLNEEWEKKAPQQDVQQETNSGDTDDTVTQTTSKLIECMLQKGRAWYIDHVFVPYTFAQIFVLTKYEGEDLISETLLLPFIDETTWNRMFSERIEGHDLLKDTIRLYSLTKVLPSYRPLLQQKGGGESSEGSESSGQSLNSHEDLLSNFKQFVYNTHDNLENKTTNDEVTARLLREEPFSKPLENIIVATEDLLRVIEVSNDENSGASSQIKKIAEDAKNLREDSSKENVPLREAKTERLRVQVLAISSETVNDPNVHESIAAAQEKSLARSLQHTVAHTDEIVEKFQNMDNIFRDNNSHENDGDGKENPEQNRNVPNLDMPDDMSGLFSQNDDGVGVDNPSQEPFSHENDGAGVPEAGYDLIDKVLDDAVQAEREKTQELHTMFEQKEKEKQKLEMDLEKTKREFEQHKRAAEAAKQTLEEQRNELTGDLEKFKAQVVAKNLELQEAEKTVQKLEDKVKTLDGEKKKNQGYAFGTYMDPKRKLELENELTRTRTALNNAKNSVSSLETENKENAAIIEDLRAKEQAADLRIANLEKQLEVNEKQTARVETLTESLRAASSLIQEEQPELFDTADSGSGSVGEAAAIAKIVAFYRYFCLEYLVGKEINTSDEFVKKLNEAFNAYADAEDLSEIWDEYRLNPTRPRYKLGRVWINLFSKDDDDEIFEERDDIRCDAGGSLIHPLGSLNYPISFPTTLPNRRLLAEDEFGMVTYRTTSWVAVQEEEYTHDINRLFPGYPIAMHNWTSYFAFLVEKEQYTALAHVLTRLWNEEASITNRKFLEDNILDDVRNLAIQRSGYLVGWLQRLGLAPSETQDPFRNLTVERHIAGSEFRFRKYEPRNDVERKNTEKLRRARVTLAMHATSSFTTKVRIPSWIQASYANRYVVFLSSTCPHCIAFQQSAEKQRWVEEHDAIVYEFGSQTNEPPPDMKVADVRYVPMIVFFDETGCAYHIK